MAILKRLIALAFALAAPALADQIASEKFGSLNNNDAPAIISPEQAQDILNVDITPEGKSIKKRSGYGIYKTLSGSTGIHGGYHFFDSSGNDVQLWGSSTSLWGVVANGTPTQLISSATLNTTWDCADSQGSAYCVSSSRNALIKTDGATKTWYTSPLGTMVAITPERLLVAGVGTNPSRIYYSAANNFTDFTVGITAASSSYEDIAGPGSRITHIEYAFGRWMWFKDQSFGYVIGTDQTNLQIAIVSNTVGTLDNSSIYYNNHLYFRGQDGHIYDYDGSNLTKLSLDITPLVQTSANRTSNSWTVSSQTDFNTGAFSTTTYSSSATGVVISTNSTDTPDNSFELNTWTLAGATTVTQNQQRTTVVGFSCGTISPKSGTYMFQVQSNLTTSFSLTVSVIDATTSAVLASSTTPTSANLCGWTQQTITGLSSYVKRVGRLKITNSIDGASAISSTFTLNGNDITFWRQGDQMVGNYTKWIDLLQGGANTQLIGVYFSPVKNAQSLTSWDTFNATKTDDNGTHAFAMRSSSNSFTTTSSTPSWTTITNGAVISISTGTYFQWSDTFTVTASSNNPTLQNVTVNWFEGTASDKAYATYFKDALWWSVAYGAGQTANNYIFRYDLLNDGWTLYNFGTNGFAVQSNNLYFGDTSTGNIFRYGTGTSDNGNAIYAYWKSKDFTGSDPWMDNEYTQVDVIARRNQSQTLTVGYTLNGSTTTTSYSVPLSSTTDTTIRFKKLLPAGKIGGLFNIMFSDTSSTSAWEVLGFRVKYNPLPYRPTQ